jgi:hypothetical protein
LEQHHEQITTAGLKSLAVGLGEAKHAERYCGKLAPSLTCFAADSNEPYYAWGLRQTTVGEALTNAIGITRATASALAKGIVQGQATGDTHMLPGTFIIDRAGIVRYAYYSAHAGDNPAIPELLEAARSL